MTDRRCFVSVLQGPSKYYAEAAVYMRCSLVASGNDSTIPHILLIDDTVLPESRKVLAAVGFTRQKIERIEPPKTLAPGLDLGEARTCKNGVGRRPRGAGACARLPECADHIDAPN